LYQNSGLKKYTTGYQSTFEQREKEKWNRIIKVKAETAISKVAAANKVAVKTRAEVNRKVAAVNRVAAASKAGIAEAPAGVARAAATTAVRASSSGNDASQTGKREVSLENSPLLMMPQPNELREINQWMLLNF